MEATNITSKALRVFAVPELLSLICSFAPISDCARLSRTCRTAFNVAVAFVWNQTNGRHLLLLLGTTREVSTGKATSSKKTVISIGSPSLAKFARFDVYAPHVRELNVYGPGPPYHYYQVDGWDYLILRARQQPLLPNLSSIIFTSFACAHGSDELVWIKTFISPSLIKVEATANDIMFPISTPSLVSDVIMDTVAERCPRLLKLSLFPTPGPFPDKTKTFDNLVGFLWRRPYYESLSYLPNLVELTCNLAMFERDSLFAIGSLPALRRLAVLGLNEFPVSDLHALSTESFPALHELQLKGLDRDCMISILTIPPLMSHLTHLKLEFWLDDPESDDEDDQGEWIASNLLSRLENAPHLLSLGLDVNFIGEAHDIGRKDLMELFSKLPLETITLTGLIVHDWAYNAEYLKTAWLNVTSVHMPDQFGPPSVLKCFAQLPRLQYLEAHLYLITEVIGECPKEPSLCPLHTLKSSDNGEIGCEPEDLEYTGEFLLALFPNLRKVVWPPQKHDSPVDAAQESFVGFLNQHIALKREVEGLKAKLGTKGA